MKPLPEKSFLQRRPDALGGGFTTKGLQDPLYKLLPPFGGQQIKRTIEGVDQLIKAILKLKLAG